MKTQTEIFNAEVLFHGLENPAISYTPRIRLFKNDSVYLNGDWPEGSIKKYCLAAAKKQGITAGEINLIIIKDDQDEIDLVFDI